MAHHKEGAACLMAISKAIEDGQWGWPLVDREMQRQIGLGVTTPSAYARYFRISDLEESWARYNADPTNPETWAIPQPLPYPVIDRWGHDASHREFMSKLTPKSVWDHVYMQLTSMKIRQPGLLLREVGYSPASELGLRDLLNKIGDLKPADRARITGGDDDFLLDLLGYRQMTRQEWAELEQERTGGVR